MFVQIMTRFDVNSAIMLITQFMDKIGQMFKIE